MSAVRAGTVSVGAKVANAALALALAVLLARVLGPDAYGVYSFALALASLLVVLVQLGLPDLVVRETAASFVQGRWAAIRGVWRWSGAVALSLAAVAAASIAAAASVFGAGLSAAPAWALVLVPLIALTNLRAAALRGLHRFAPALVSEFVVRSAVLLALLFAVIAWRGAALSAVDALHLHAIAAAVALLAAGLWLRAARPPEVVGCRTVDYDAGRWLRSALPLALISAMYVVNTRVDILMLAAFEAPADVGVYQVAVSAANVVAIGLSAVNLVVAPRFAALHAQGDRAGLQRLVTRSARTVLLLTLPVAAGLALFGGALVSAVFGADYAGAHAPLAVLVAGQVVNAGFGSVGVLLNMTHNERATARGVMAAAAANVALNAVLIPAFGITGAAVATACSLALWNVLLWRSVRRLLGIETLASARVGP